MSEKVGENMSQRTSSRISSDSGAPHLLSEKEKRKEIMETLSKLGHLTVICADGHTLIDFPCDETARSSANTEGMGQSTNPKPGIHIFHNDNKRRTNSYSLLPAAVH